MDKIEIKNLSTDETTVFPCNRWLSKEKEDGEIARDLFPEIPDDRRSYDGSLKSPRNSFRERNDDPFVVRNARSRENERPPSFRESKDDFNFRERNDRVSLRSERDLNRERERDMFRSPRRNNF